MTSTAPLYRFLGDVPAHLGPFGLLGLDPKPCTPEQVNTALRNRLARLARHPQGMGAGADEVRLALHVAAAQLRDPAVQREVLTECRYIPTETAQVRESTSTYSPSSGQQDESLKRAHPAQIGMQVAARTSSAAMFERAALWVLAHSGGWNEESKRRLGSLAHTFDIKPNELRTALIGVGRRLASQPTIQGRTIASVNSSHDPEPDATATPIAGLATRRHSNLMRGVLLTLLAVSTVAMIVELVILNRPTQSTVLASTQNNTPEISESGSLATTPLELQPVEIGRAHV